MKKTKRPKLKKIIIKCKGTTEKYISEMNNLQGDFKRLDPQNREKLKASIVKHGFRVPIFMWKKYLIDGTQRYTVLKILKNEGYKIPKIPVVEIPARNVDEAKKTLLLINSRFGEITRKGFTQFTAELDLSEFMKELSIPEIPMIQKLIGEKVPDLEKQAPDPLAELPYSIRYDLVFNNEVEQAKFMKFIKGLRKRYPALDTISERVIKFVEDNNGITD